MEFNNMPAAILAITVTLIILGIGMFSFFFVLNTTEQEADTRMTENFGVTDPNVDQTLTLKSPASTINTVQFYNGTTWRTIPAAGYTSAYKTVVVDQSYLY